MLISFFLKYNAHLPNYLLGIGMTKQIEFVM